MIQKLNRGDLVMITHCYEYPDLEGHFGMIMGMTEIDFADENRNDKIEIFDVQCCDYILQSYSDDLELVKDEKQLADTISHLNKDKSAKRVDLKAYKTITV